MSSSSPYRILVNKKQKGNPILKFIRNVPWGYDAIVPDYELGRCTCALYLSVRYNDSFPECIHSRLKELGKAYDLRKLLVQVDAKQQDISHELNQLSRICILAGCTMILAFSSEEAGRYLEVYKAYENKPPTDIMAKAKSDFLSQATEFLTAVKGVNKTDVTTLLTRFKAIKARAVDSELLPYYLVSTSTCREVPPSVLHLVIGCIPWGGSTMLLSLSSHPEVTLACTEEALIETIEGIINADVDSLSLCPGIGHVKAQRIHNTFANPFLNLCEVFETRPNADPQPEECPVDALDNDIDVMV